MTGLQGYQSKPVQIQQAPQAQPLAASMASRELETLSGKLEKFSQFMYQKQAETTAIQAKDDALRDAAEGKPFYREAVYTAYGKAYNNTLTATYAANADIAINKKSNELAMELENNPMAYDKAMGDYVREMSRTAPSPELQTVIGLSGEKVKNAAYGQLAQAENRRIKKSQLETFQQEWEENLGQIVNLQAQNNSRDAEILKDKNIAHMGTLVRDGILTPEVAQKFVKDAEFKITNGVALENMKGLLAETSLENAEKYLQAETEQHRGDMDIHENDVHQASLLKMYQNEVRKRDAAEVDKTDFANQIVGDATKVRNNHGVPANVEEVNIALKSASPAKVWEYEKAERVQKIIGGYGLMSLQQQQNLLDQYAVKVKGKDVAIEDVEVFEYLKKNLKARETASKDDAVGQAQREGIIQALPLMGSDAGIDGLIHGLEMTKSNSNIIKGAFGQGKEELITKQDAKSWTGYLETSSADEQLGFITKVAAYNYDKAKIIFKQIGGKNAETFAFASTQALAGNERASRLALMGKGADVVLPEGFAIDLKTKLADAFGGYDSEVFNQHYKGITDYTKGLTLEGGDTSNMGDIIAGSIGEIQSYNDKSVVLPQGVTKRAFESWLDDIEIPGRPGMQEGLRDMTDMFFDGDYQLVYAAPGEYYVRVANGGNPYLARDSEDDTKPYLLKWGQ